MQRMGASRSAGKRLLSFLTNAQIHGTRTALRVLNLEALAGRSIDEIFLGLADYVCPNTGSIDDGIAREAFVETIVDLTELGFTDLDALTPDQLQTVFELYATHAIEARLCNDIGTKIIAAPINAQTAQNIQKQLFDFIRNGVSDALTEARSETPMLTLDRVNTFVDSVYERTFEILHALGEAEVNQ